MNQLIKTIAGFSAAEEFFQFFGVEYDQAVVNVNRLHILKRFHQYLRTSPLPSTAPEAELFAACKGHLQAAYKDFVRSTPAQEKVFKVFQDTDGKQHVSLDSLRVSLPTHS